ncbi:MAG: prepilin peptidase [Planctomycetaceae bacterium]
MPSTWVYAILLALLAVAAVTDVRRHKIYNWNTYPGIVAGLVLNGLTAGWIGVGGAALGFLVCGFVMLLCFVLFDMGGGDVKLIAMMGAFLGFQKGVEAMLWTFVLGAVMGMAIVIWRYGFLTLLANAWRHVRLVFQAWGWISLTKEEREPLQRWLFLAPSALAAVGVVMAEEQTGVLRRLLG